MTPTPDARTMSAAEYASARVEMIEAPRNAAIRRQDAAALAAARERHPDLAKAFDAAAHKAAAEAYPALAAKLIEAELVLTDAKKLAEIAAAGPSELDRSRAAERLAVAATTRDALTVQTEAAHAAAFSTTPATGAVQ